MRGGIGKCERPLPEIVEHQRGANEEDPRAGDGRPAEVAQIRVEGFATRDHEEDAAHDDERHFAVMGQEVNGLQRIERCQHAGILRDLVNPQRGQHREPQQHDPPKPFSERRRPLGLHRKKPHQDADGERNDEGLDHGLDRLGREQALHRGDHGDGRRDDAIPVEQRGPGDAHHEDDTAGHAAGFRLLRKGQREQREDPAFALVIGPRDDGDILHRDEDGEAPDDQRQHADDFPLGVKVAVMQALLEGVEDARADVAVGHAERANRERERGRLGGLLHERRSVPERPQRRNSIVRRKGAWPLARTAP